MTHGWFDPRDLTNNMPPITIDIDVTVFGRQHVINAAHSPEVDFYRLNYTYGLESDYPEARAAMEATLQQAMAKAHARLIESIGAVDQPVAPHDPTEPAPPETQ